MYPRNHKRIPFKLTNAVNPEALLQNVQSEPLHINPKPNPLCPWLLKLTNSQMYYNSVDLRPRLWSPLIPLRCLSRLEPTRGRQGVPRRAQMRMIWKMKRNAMSSFRVPWNYSCGCKHLNHEYYHASMWHQSSCMHALNSSQHKYAYIKIFMHAYVVIYTCICGLGFRGHNILHPAQHYHTSCTQGTVHAALCTMPSICATYRTLLMFRTLAGSVASWFIIS